MWRFLKNLGIELPYNPAILGIQTGLLGIQIEETRIEIDTCTRMFIAAGGTSGKEPPVNAGDNKRLGFHP